MNSQSSTDITIGELVLSPFQAPAWNAMIDSLFSPHSRLPLGMQFFPSFQASAWNAIIYLCLSCAEVSSRFRVFVAKILFRRCWCYHQQQIYPRPARLRRVQVPAWNAIIYSSYLFTLTCLSCLCALVAKKYIVFLKLPSCF